MVRKVWSFVGALSVLGLVFVALPQLPALSLTRWDGVFSLAWLLLASCVLVGHSRELFRVRPRKKRNVAIVSLRPPRRVQPHRMRGQS